MNPTEKEPNPPASGMSGYFEKILKKYDNKVLVYKGFSVVYLQTFGIRECNLNLFPDFMQPKGSDSIDHQIFVTGQGVDMPVVRYRLPGFDFELELPQKLKNPYDVKITGHMSVEMSLFLNYTVTITYRMRVDGKNCEATANLTTDHMIGLVSMHLRSEHWSAQNNGGGEEIDQPKCSLVVKDCPFDANGLRSAAGERVEGENAFDRIRDRYRRAVQMRQEPVPYQDYNFTLVDVWEDVDTFDGTLQAIPEEGEMITFIENRCKSELVGLMSQYPREWPYRREEAFGDVCGENIAIDTDDLVLANTRMGLVLGTYGRRSGEDAPTNWNSSLSGQRKEDDVSWPEYLLILEMVLAKKYTIAAVRNELLRFSSSAKVQDARKSIEKSASLGLRIMRLLMKLEAVHYCKYMSHKIMFERTVRRLKVEQDERELRDLMDRVNTSLSVLCEESSVRQAATLNIFLAAVSIASLLQIIFQEPVIPVIDRWGDGWGRVLGEIVQWFVGFGIALASLFVIYLMIYYEKWRSILPIKGGRRIYDIWNRKK